MKYTYTFLVLLFFSNLSFAQELEELSFYPINGSFGIASQGNHLYLSNGDIINISDVFHPILTSQVSFSDLASSIIIEGDFAYFGTGMSNTVHIADMSNISFPLVVSSHPFLQGNGVFGMDIKDDVLFLTLGLGGIVCSMDISDKNSPSVIQTMTIPGGQCRDIVIKNEYAYAAHAGGLKVIDISNPSNMQIISSIGNAYNSIDLEGDLLCLGKNGGGVDIYNISSPINPNPVISIPNSYGTAWSVKIQNQHIYLATDLNGLYVYKLGENDFTEIDQFKRESNGQSFDVCLNDSIILLPGLIEGVSLLAFDTVNIVKTNEMENLNHATISPNPCQQYVTINSPYQSIESVKIQNLNGELINEFFNVASHHPIDLSFLSSGIYIISIRTSDFLQMEKIIKI